jgi:dTDP-4-dehydrorhamnose 3,5-epimerase
MIFEELPLKNSFLILPEMIKDDRGEFGRIYCCEEFGRFIEGKKIVQVNHSVNKHKGTIRGMHYQQTPHLEAKMIRCIKGAVYDVIIDIRINSKTFLKWYSVELSAMNKKMLYVPEGFAHGFQVLLDDTELIYFHTGFYNKKSEGGISYNDPQLGIKWPLPPAYLTDRDLSNALIDNNFKGVLL